MLQWIRDNVFDYGSFVEWMGLLAAALVLVSFLMKDERTIRIVNIVGAVVFVVYGILIKSASVWLMNFALVVVHIVRLKKLTATSALPRSEPCAEPRHDGGRQPSTSSAARRAEQNSTSNAEGNSVGASGQGNDVDEK